MVPQPGLEVTAMFERFAEEQEQRKPIGPACHVISFIPSGQSKANDLLDHQCIDESETRDHASLVGHRIGTERPKMVRSGNFILVTNGVGDEPDRVPLASSTTV
jgi:hypothetical protein